MGHRRRGDAPAGWATVSDDALQIRADSIEEADIEDIWVAGHPLGKLVERASERGKRVDDDLGERSDHVDDDAQLWALVEQLSAEVSRLREEITPDTDGKNSHSSLARRRPTRCASPPSRTRSRIRPTKARSPTAR